MQPFQTEEQEEKENNNEIKEETLETLQRIWDTREIIDYPCLGGG